MIHQNHRLFTRDAQQALGFLISQVTHIEAEIVRILYPDIQYPALIPVDTTAPEWSKSVTFFSLDRVGRAEWFHHMATDMRVADVQRSKHEQTIEMAGIGYRYTLEEIGQAMLVGTSLTTERAEAARRSAEEFIDNLVLRGDTSKGMSGLINSSLVTIVSAPPTGTGGSAAWEDKTGDQIITDINSILSGIWTASLTIEMADTLLLPPASLSLIATKRVDTNGSNISVLDWITKYNIYTQQTGQALTIRAVRGLETAGTGGDKGRAVAYRRDPGVLKMHMPMPHRFMPVWQTGPLTFDIPGIFRLGGLEIRRPGSVRYLDGIFNPTS